LLRRTLQRPVRYSTYFVILSEAKDSNKFSEKSVSLYLTKRKENKSGRSYKTKWNFRHEKAPNAGLWKKTKTIILHQSNPLS
jgi:hypothetical protein